MRFISLKSSGRGPFSKDDSHVGPVQVTAVGMSTEWGKLMATISEDNDEETPLQVSNGLPCTILYALYRLPIKTNPFLFSILSFCLCLGCCSTDFALFKLKKFKDKRRRNLSAPLARLLSKFSVLI